MQNKMLLKTPIMSPCAFHLAGVAYFMPLRLCVIGAWKPSTDNTLDHSAWETYIFCTSPAGFMTQNICIKPNNYPQGVDHLPLLFLTWSCHPSNLLLEIIAQAPRCKIIHCVTSSRNLSRPLKGFLVPRPSALEICLRLIWGILGWQVLSCSMYS